MALESLEIDKLLTEVAVLAASMEGTDGLSCGIVLRSRGRPVVVACSNEVATRLEEFQHAIGNGPGLTAMYTGRATAVEDTAQSRRWTEFEARAAAEGIGSSLSVPLAVGDSGVGALSLYAPGAGAFAETQLRLAHGVAAVVAGLLALALGRAEQTHLVENLRAALAARAIIDQALGILMAQQRCTSDEAFVILRKASQNRNIKLRDLATGIVQGVSGRP
jgi:GAF domain-containing protein